MASGRQLRTRVDVLTKAHSAALKAAHLAARTADTGKKADSFRATHSKLRELLPSDAPQLVHEGYAVRITYGEGFRHHDDKLAELAARIRAKRVNDEDRAVLAAMPRSALRTIGMTGRTFITMMADIQASC